MVHEGKNYKSMGGPTPLDESWWKAVMEEAEAHLGAPKKKKQPKTPIQEIDSSDNTPEADWDQAKELYQQDQVIDLVVSGHNRGGLLVEGNGLQGFVPVSHLVADSKGCTDEEQETLLDSYAGRTLRLKVIECDPERGRVVFSERAALADPGRRIELLDSLKEGDCILGRITTITDFGAFVELGGIEGLIHISELSWGRVCHPKDVVSPGQEIEVCIVQIDRERSRVALSLKRLLSNPWETIHSRYQPGQIAEAVITNLVSFGAFARLEDGLDGLIHVSELNDDGKNIRPGDIFTEGQQVKVRILHIDPDRQRMGLSLYDG
jgi:small subunit ribosomal protein S1